MQAVALVLSDARQQDCRVARFAELCDAHDLQGLMFQHLAICPRRAWLHMHRIDYAHLEDRMARGSAMHTMSKVRDRSVEGLFGISPDRIDWKRHVVVEAKGRRGATEAVSRQTMFYALMLRAKTGMEWLPAIEIISERRTTEMEISQEDVTIMLSAAERLVALKAEDCPSGIDAPICRTCSYQYLCGRS